MVNPIFLFSLPRSGSTLLQRILSTHADIATAPEPWILLPLLGIQRSETYSDYGHRMARCAIQDFKRRIENEGGDFERELRTFVLRLYSLAAESESKFFLDKTPRYHLIAQEILDLFVDARTLILWRNPLSIMASIIQTWGEGRWNLYRYKVDFYRGLPRLVELSNEDRENILSIRYEDLVSKKSETLNTICSHLGIEYQGLKGCLPKIEGKVGDPTQGRYQSISRASINKWRKVICNPYRKMKARKYLQWLGAGRLSTMGYSYDHLVHELEEAPTTCRYLMYDLIDSVKESVWPVGEYELYKRKMRSEREGIIHHS